MISIEEYKVVFKFVHKIEEQEALIKELTTKLTACEVLTSNAIERFNRLKAGTEAFIEEITVNPLCKKLTKKEIQERAKYHQTWMNEL